MATTNYVVDANVYIDAYRRYYAFAFSTKFWEILKHSATTGRIVSIDRVKQELLSQKDDLSSWATNEYHEAFVSTDRPDVIMYYARLNTWAQSQPQFSTAAKAEFARTADAWIVAYALAGGHTVVTHEVFRPNIQSSIKIPNACKAFGIPCINPFEMLRELKARLG